MLDSVTLLIPSQKFIIINSNWFRPNVALVYQNQVIKSVAHATKQDLLIHTYMPKVTVSRRMNMQGVSDIMLTVEVSLPKLLFGNNLEELRVKDFDAVVAVLQSKLICMGVEITVDNLKGADISSVHFSKNIIFRDGTVPFSYIQQMQHSIVSAKLDTNTTHYRNAGYAFKWHCNSYEIIAYDKLYDLQRSLQGSVKRSVDRDNFLNLKDIQFQRSKKKKFEVLRIEVRLNKRLVIKRLFNTLRVKSNITLQQVFKTSIMNKVLLYYINMIQAKRPLICDFTTMSKKQLLSTLMVLNPDLTPRNLLSYIGYSLLLEDMKPNEINILFKRNHQKSMQRLLKELNMIILPIVPSNHSFDEIIKQIKTYKPFRLKRTL